MVLERWRLLPSLRSEGGQLWLLATASLEATGISCHTLAFGFKPAPFEVTFEEQRGPGQQKSNNLHEVKAAN